MLASVVIPTFNQSESLRFVLEGFCQQTYKNFEVIVVDDGSSEDICSVVEMFQKNFDIRLVQLEKNSGRSVARNTGIAEAKGKLIIFNDSDRIPCNEFVQRHLEYHEGYSNLVCIGEIRELYFSDLKRVKELLLNEINQNFKKYKRLSRKPGFVKVIDHLYVNGKNQSSIPWISFLVGNLSIRKEWIMTELFDSNFIKWGFEHMELGYRLYKKGLQYGYNNEAANYHLAHSRSESYEELIRESHAYFYEKHSKKEVEKLLDFLFGEITLKEFDEIVAGESKIDEGIYYPTIKKKKII
ncbi:MAG: glycosyltransferase family 2 protein [Halanaerobiales bacterium]|nr:glycosyltransferase family 2 protein [Halanaerobiales bacterium]